MSADWYPGIKAFCAHWRQAPMLQQTFETLEREFADENDACQRAHRRLAHLLRSLRGSTQGTLVSYSRHMSHIRDYDGAKR